MFRFVSMLLLAFASITTGLQVPAVGVKKSPVRVKVNVALAVRGHHENNMAEELKASLEADAEPEDEHVGQITEFCQSRAHAVRGHMLGSPNHNMLGSLF